MHYVNKADWTRQQLAGIQRRFVVMILSITALIVTCLILQARHPYFFEFEDADFDYKVTPIGKPWHADFKYNVLLNGHCHTNNPEDDGQLSNRQVIKWHIANGFNATVITGHNSLMPAKRTRDLARAEYDKELKVLLGMEWTNCRMHMNLIGIEHEPPNWKYPSDEQIRQVIDMTHEQGGVAVLNHIPWSIPRMLDYPSKELMAQWGVDYIEVASSEYFDLQTYLYVRDQHLGMITGTDMHYPEPVHAWTLLEAEEFTEEAIMKQLRERRTSFIYDAYGRRGTEQWRWKKFNSFISPFVLLGEVIRYNFYLEDKGMWSFVDGTFCEEDRTVFYLHWGMIAITLFWVLLLFVLGEIARLIVQHYWQQHCKTRWGRELKQQSFKYSL